MGAALFLIIPGIYVACRLITCVPSALLEDLGPRSSLERSFALTKDFAGRAFLIFFLYFLLSWAAAMLFTFPFSIAMVISAARNPEGMRIWMALTNVGSFVAGVLVAPFLTIATAVFYYDLRVRKEAFDLQLMMNPSGQIPSGAPGVFKMFS
jgi:membrane-anchored glycerophosphoryl diester phosphodiesterase (GDPDase)